MTDQDRIDVYNAGVRALADEIVDLVSDPAIRPQLIAAEFVTANDYNPNKVAHVEMDLLEQSIRADGITMAVVTCPDGAGRWVVVDGFHRRTVAVTRLGRRWVPVTEIRSELGERMASTVRHNRARGKHQVDLMGSLVTAMIAQEWSDERIAAALGMSVEELLRLKQIMGVAALLAGSEYSQAWGEAAATAPAFEEPADGVNPAYG